MAQEPQHSGSLKYGGVFAGVAVLWLVLDRLTKIYFENAYELGQTSVHDYLVVRFRLIHNTGAAWGIFSDSTFALGCLSLVVCALVVAAWLMWDKAMGRPATLVETLALSLVFSGGLGNCIDRFMQGYVIDFLDFTFMDFPVFNVADIGVTCGFALLVIAYLVLERNSGAAEAESADGAEDADAVEVADAPETSDASEGDQA